MATHAHPPNRPILESLTDFSLTRGGLFFRLAGRFKLLPRSGQLGTRLVLGAAGLCWIPVVLLVLLEHFTTGSWDPLFTRTELHVRMLFSLTLLLWGEWFFEQRVRSTSRHLLDHDFIPEAKQASWREVIIKVLRVRDSWAPEITLLVCVYAISLIAYMGYLEPHVLRWLAPTIHEAGVHWEKATPAWWWYMLISQPLFLFVLLRWISRWFLYTNFMWSLARMPPAVQPLHSDRAGGLLFLAEPLLALRFFALATSGALMSVWLDELDRSKAQPAIFAADIIVFVAISMGLAVLPYLPFTRVLAEGKHRSLLACSAVMDRYTRRFEDRWYPLDEARDDERMLGNEDFSGLVDSGSSYAVLEDMRITLPGPKFLKAHFVAAVLPFVVIMVIYGPPAADVLKAILGRLVEGGE
ncbi:MAG: hypothetical protein QM778_07775 [Myxococcales bacterium]